MLHTIPGREGQQRSNQLSYTWLALGMVLEPHVGNKIPRTFNLEALHALFAGTKCPVAAA